MKIGFLFMISIFVGISGCYGAHSLRPSQAPGYLRLDVKPEHAIVYIDEKLYGDMGSIPTQTIALVPGLRRILIRARGFETERFDIQLKSGEEVSLSLHLLSELRFDDVEDAPKKKIFLK